MQYYVVFEDNGNILTFLRDDLHTIPDDAVPISEQDWEKYIVNTYQYKRDGDTIRKKTAQELADENAGQPEPPKSIEQELVEIRQLIADLALIQMGG